MRTGTDYLVVTAVEVERDAIRAAADAAIEVHAVGVGPAQAAAGTARLLATRSPRLVLCAGIAGGFRPARLGDVVVATAAIAADLGAETDEGFRTAEQLGFGRVRYDVDVAVAAELARRSGGLTGAVLSVSTVTGTAARADQLTGWYPDALAEAMEGVGVAEAALGAGCGFAEVRAISNHVGPRDVAAWRIPDAVRALGAAVAAITGAPWTL